MRRSPIKRRSAKKQATDAVLAEAREAVMARAGWWPECHRVGFGSEHVCRDGFEIHHRLPRSRGGTHDLDNLVVLCAAGHREVHANPEWAYTVGLLLRSAS